ncbi:MAG: 16S rRNA (uracil(1498)-N(3))-methyltransferase [Thermodesulfobacteriota bacterium]
MSAPRFFIDPAALRGDRALLTGPEAHHARKVLRLAAGDSIILLDGRDTRHLARIERIGPEGIEAVILESRQAPLPVTQVHLCQGVLKGQKMELVYQKATELGATAIWPFISEHCARHGEQGNRPERWRRISLEACKQCDQARPPRINEVLPLAELFAQLPESRLRLMLWEGETQQSLAPLLRDGLCHEAAILLIGPEGGFSAAEVVLARQAGFHTVSLGRLVLRAETASLAALAIVQHELGNLTQAGGPVP